MDVHAAAFGEVQEGFASSPYSQGPYRKTTDSEQQPQETYTGHGGGGGAKSFFAANVPKDMLDQCCNFSNKSLVIFRLFYLFFFAAFGSLFPLISVYFKQIGMNGTQTGVLSGIRCLVECFGAPFWSQVAEKWKKGKSILVGSICCWIIFNLTIGFIKPGPVACLVTLPMQGLALEAPFDIYSVDSGLESTPMEVRRLKDRHSRKIGQSPIVLDLETLIYPNETKNYMGHVLSFIDPNSYPKGSLVMPLYSTVVYTPTKINQCFGIILIVILIGEIFASPTVCMADSAVILYLENERSSDSYGRQRMFGSFGWGISMFLIGLALDYSSTFPDHPCKSPGPREKNYFICFTVFIVLMISALIVATQFNFGYEGSQESMYFKMVKDKLSKTFLGRQTKNRGKFENEEDDQQPQSKDGMTNEDILEQQLGVKFDRSQQQQKSGGENPYADELAATAQLKVTKWNLVFKNFSTPQLGIFLFVVWFMGLGVGIVFTFLFWHMQELKGTPTLFGIASVINHISEIAAYYFSKPILDKIGHMKMLYAGLLANVFRFMWVSWINNPWWILPFEFLQGLTHAGVWAACCSYISQSFPSDMRLSIQGFLQGVHHGLGRGLGAIFGGIVISSYGSSAMFCAYGVASGIVFLIFLAAEVLLSRQTQTDTNYDYTGQETANVDQSGQFLAQPVIGGSEYYESSVGYTLPNTGTTYISS
ncbi:Major facilitator superfamily domain-containing protein 6 [Cichlidogyrus casuarinus]|uniref:Major facilitator superfamily domain-containing protein 6 n=1 Tax=Cichlidogyrus casuarinus TaxID=1844966 RepID=A0ABD2Q1K3_9PLAT